MGILGSIAGVLAIVANVIIMLVIVQFVLSLLIAFNVVNMSNQFVSTVYEGVNALLDPLLRPIRRLMPDTGAIDFSPLVLIVGLNIVIYLLNRAAYGVLI